MYKCPECNTPLNGSMFCVNCCSKWTKNDGVAKKNSELIDAAQKILKDSFVTEFDLISFYNKEENKEKKTSKQLADEHWGYIEGLLKAHGEDDDFIEKIGFHYRSAFIHGYKHAMEDK